MANKNIAVCWAQQIDKNFLETSLDEDWGLKYIEDLETLNFEVKRGSVDLVLVKLEKGNVNEIISSRMKLRLLQQAYGIPIALFVMYTNSYNELNYQMLMVEDTEIIIVNPKNFEKIMTGMIPQFTMYSSIANYGYYHPEGRSNNFVA